MKKLCAFTISFLFLKFSLILCCLSEPSCFWRIRNSEDSDGDLQRECHFYLWLIDESIEDNFVSDLNFRFSLDHLILTYATMTGCPMSIK
ncbi:mCG120116, isoform CRA_a [Mus musculus]|uniref:Vomeronasal 2, receptor 121 n=1 Tax=Mus musculus TaxID=10090 RepID=A0A3B2W7Z9_MOUSE|nr:mCG120116, isoform CRA_a [Mus musculus]